VQEPCKRSVKQSNYVGVDKSAILLFDILDMGLELLNLLLLCVPCHCAWSVPADIPPLVGTAWYARSEPTLQRMRTPFRDLTVCTPRTCLVPL
jgi:hypothetical protein